MAGAPALQARVEAEIRRRLTQARDPHLIVADAREMRRPVFRLCQFRNVGADPRRARNKTLAKFPVPCEPDGFKSGATEREHDLPPNQSISAENKNAHGSHRS